MSDHLPAGIPANGRYRGDLSRRCWADVAKHHPCPERAHGSLGLCPEHAAIIPGPDVHPRRKDMLA